MKTIKCPLHSPQEYEPKVWKEKWIKVYWKYIWRDVVGQKIECTSHYQNHLQLTNVYESYWGSWCTWGKH